MIKKRKQFFFFFLTNIIKTKTKSQYKKNNEQLRKNICIWQ